MGDKAPSPLCTPLGRCPRRRRRALGALPPLYAAPARPAGAAAAAGTRPPAWVASHSLARPSVAGRPSESYVKEAGGRPEATVGPCRAPAARERGTDGGTRVRRRPEGPEKPTDDVFLPRFRFFEDELKDPMFRLSVRILTGGQVHSPKRLDTLRKENRQRGTLSDR